MPVTYIHLAAFPSCGILHKAIKGNYDTIRGRSSQAKYMSPAFSADTLWTFDTLFLYKKGRVSKLTFLVRIETRPIFLAQK